MVNDRSPVTLYLLSETEAQLNARDAAIEMPRRAIDAGFRDVALLEMDPAFRRLRNDPQSTALLDRLRSSGDALGLLTVDRPQAPILVC